MLESRPDSLSVERIARHWKEECTSAAITAEDIARDLVEAALQGEFNFPAKDDAERSQPNFDPRLGRLVETYISDGRCMSRAQVKNASKAIQHPLPQRYAFLAQYVHLSMEGLRRWCERPDFDDWARIRCLSRPSFSGVLDTEQKTGKSTRPKRPKRQRQRKVDGQADAELANRLKSVLADARRKWPKQRYLSDRQMALVLTEDRTSKPYGFGYDAIRKILRGTYHNMDRLAIKGLER